ncbi:MAG: hypothetical protein RLY61_191 [Candidatus Parcubacteria bacterium]|jgi:hypothetical protein
MTVVKVAAEAAKAQEALPASETIVQNLIQEGLDVCIRDQVDRILEVINGAEAARIRIIENNGGKAPGYVDRSKVDYDRLAEYKAELVQRIPDFLLHASPQEQVELIRRIPPKELRRAAFVERQQREIYGPTHTWEEVFIGLLASPEASTEAWQIIFDTFCSKVQNEQPTNYAEAKGIFWDITTIPQSIFLMGLRTEGSVRETIVDIWKRIIQIRTNIKNIPEDLAIDTSTYYPRNVGKDIRSHYPPLTTAALSDAELFPSARTVLEDLYGKGEDGELLTDTLIEKLQSWCDIPNTEPAWHDQLNLEGYVTSLFKILAEASALNTEGPHPELVTIVRQTIIRVFPGFSRNVASSTESPEVYRGLIKLMDKHCETAQFVELGVVLEAFTNKDITHMSEENDPVRRARVGDRLALVGPTLLKGYMRRQLVEEFDRVVAICKQSGILKPNKDDYDGAVKGRESIVAALQDILQSEILIGTEREAEIIDLILSTEEAVLRRRTFTNPEGTALENVELVLDYALRTKNKDVTQRILTYLINTGTDGLTSFKLKDSRTLDVDELFPGDEEVRALLTNAFSVVPDLREHPVGDAYWLLFQSGNVWPWEAAQKLIKKYR